MLNVIYTIKACMLIMYSRLTLGLTAQRLVFYLAIYVAVRPSSFSSYCTLYLKLTHPVRLGGNGNCLLHSLHTFLGLLCHASTRSSMHNPPALCDRPSLFQHLLRHPHALHPASPHHPSRRAPKTKMHSLNNLLHGHIRHHRRNPYQVLQPLQHLGPVIHDVVHSRKFSGCIRKQFAYDMATDPGMDPELANRDDEDFGRKSGTELW